MRPWFWVEPNPRPLSETEKAHLQSRMDMVAPPDEARPAENACGQCDKPLNPNGKSQSEAIPWSLNLPSDDGALTQRIRSRWGLPDPGKDVA